jgi:isoaspartyl peptidase/L-asparaginase-like protein (Ntn-hydrolase superfamily)
VDFAHCADFQRGNCGWQPVQFVPYHLGRASSDLKKNLFNLRNLRFHSCAFSRRLPSADTDMKFRLVVHGGAGAIKKEKMTPEKEAAYRAALETALRAGYGVLSKGGAALDAVIASIKVMEDSPLFNAGKGAVFNHDGRNELDASLMDGRTLASAAVTEITTLKNPIIGAHLVMTKSKHVMLAGKGADDFAAAHGAETVSPDYYRTEERWEELQKAKEKEEKEEKDGNKHTSLQLKKSLEQLAPLRSISEAISLLEHRPAV